MSIKTKLDIIKKALLHVLKSTKQIIGFLVGTVIPTLVVFVGFQEKPTSFKIICSLVILLIIVIALTIWNMADSHAKTLIQLSEAISTYSDRRYKHYYSKWYLTLEDDETYHIEVEGKRHMLCLKDSIDWVNISFGLPENTTPFSNDVDYGFELVNLQRIKYEGMVSAEPHPYKVSASNLSFRIYFHPALRPDDEVIFGYKHALPHYKAATMEKLRELEHNKTTEAYDFVFRTIDVDKPTDLFEIVHEYAPECKARARGISQVSTGAEIELPDSAIQTVVHNNVLYQMQLKLQNPEINTTYRLSWLPPSRKDLSPSFQASTENGACPGS